MRCINMSNSKFQVGQSAHWIYKKDNKYYIHDDMFMVQRVSLDELGHHYSLVDSNEDIIDWCREEDIFASLADAQKEWAVRTIRQNLSVNAALLGGQQSDKEMAELQLKIFRELINGRY